MVEGEKKIKNWAIYAESCALGPVTNLDDDEEEEEEKEYSSLFSCGYLVYSTAYVYHVRCCERLYQYYSIPS